MAFGYIANLYILDHDVAGEVVEVSNSTDKSLFKVGGRVVDHAVSFDKRSIGAPEGACQEYVVLRSDLVAEILDNISYERTCVVPLGLSTAAAGLFQKDMLALEHPKATNATI